MIKTIVSISIVIILIVFPTIILAVGPQYYNPLTQVLFDLLLFGASAWFAFTISNQDAKKNATAKWLPPAEIACNELITLSASAKRIRLKQKNASKLIREIAPDIPQDKLEPINQFIKMHCDEISERLINLEDHMEDSCTNWKIFIRANCEKDECYQIQDRLLAKKGALEDQIESDFPQNA